MVTPEEIAITQSKMMEPSYWSWVSGRGRSWGWRWTQKNQKNPFRFHNHKKSFFFLFSDPAADDVTVALFRRKFYANLFYEATFIWDFLISPVKWNNMVIVIEKQTCTEVCRSNIICQASNQVLTPIQKQSLTTKRNKKEVVSLQSTTSWRHNNNKKQTNTQTKLSHISWCLLEDRRERERAQRRRWWSLHPKCPRARARLLNLNPTAVEHPFCCIFSRQSFGQLCFHLSLSVLVLVST